MPLRKPKAFDVDGHRVTVDASEWSRVQPLIPRMRAVQMTAGNSASVVFLVNHGTTNRPAYQPLPHFIAHASMVEYWMLKDRTDPGNHTKANLVRG